MALLFGVPLGTVAGIRAAHGPTALVWLIAVISLSDTAQYYAGTMFGRRKLSPVVSPGKTVEGAVGGFVAAYITGALLAPWALPSMGVMSAGSSRFFSALSASQSILRITLKEVWKNTLDADSWHGGCRAPGRSGS